jgi:hypothetical protein
VRLFESTSNVSCFGVLHRSEKSRGARSVFTRNGANNFSQMKRQRVIPHFVTSTVFFESIGIHFTLGLRLIELGVLKPIAFCNGRLLFPAGLEAVGQAKAIVAVYKLKRNRAHQNLKELAHV